jgi:hypothetical protein
LQDVHDVGEQICVFTKARSEIPNVIRREAVREYWTRQWTLVSPHVEPVSFHRTADGAIIAEVRQSVRDLEGKPLQGQTHGLKDKTVGHVFRFREGKVARFVIQDAA